MKVLIDALSARQGGGQTYLLNLLNYLPTDIPLQIFLLASKRLALYRPDPRIRRLQIFWPTENPFLRVIWQRIALPQALRNLNVDVFFCPGGVISTKIPANCLTVTMFRNMLPFDQWQRVRYPFGYMRIRNWLLEISMLRSMTTADLVIFISNYARRVIESSAPGSIKQSVVIPHGVGGEFRRNGGPLSRPDWLSHNNYLLYVSTVDIYKAQLEVVRAYAMLRQLRPSTQEKLLLVGPVNNSAYAKHLQLEIERSGLTNWVLMCGSVPYRDLPALYQNALVNIFASESENCPNILLESLAAGRPVLCSSLPPMPEFGGDAPLYFNPRVPEELARKLVSVLDNPARLETLGKRAAYRALEYDWRESADRTWTAIYNLTRLEVQMVN